MPEETRALVELEPLGAATVLVVDVESGAPVPGAELELRESYYVPEPVGRQGLLGMKGGFYTSDFGALRTFRTDALGRATVDGLCDEVRHELRVRARGYGPASGRRNPSTRLRAGAEPVRIELAPLALRSVRWPIVAGEMSSPPDGTRLALRFVSGVAFPGMPAPELPGPARVEAAHVVVEGVSGSVDLLAQTPDGALATLWVNASAELGEEVSFHPARRLDVLVRDPAGTPVAGARVIARSLRSDDLCPWVVTDAEGRARLSVLLDGVRRLPARFSVYSPAGAKVVEELPGRGQLVLEVDGAQPGSSAEVWLHAAGRQSTRFELDFPAEGGEALAEVELEPTSLLIARVIRPAGSYIDLNLQQFDLDTVEWGRSSSPSHRKGLTRPNGPGDTFVFEGLTRGLWRLFDERSKFASEEVELLAGEREVHLEFELGAVEWVKGRVVVDDPAELARVRVVVVDGGAQSDAGWRPGSGPPEGTPLKGDTFRVRVPDDRQVELVAWHPWLVTEDGLGRLRVQGGSDGVVLRLVPGDELRLPTAGVDGWLRVARYAGEVEGVPLEWHPAPIEGDVARCRLPRGRWTLWIDPGPPLAPFALRDVEVAGITELAPPPLGPGSSIRLKIIAPVGQAVPRAHLSATSVGALAYDRQASSAGEAELVLSGLAAGRFRVRMRAVMDRRWLPEREVELDGVNDFELELDLR